MTDEEELACQSILYPSLPKIPTVYDSIDWRKVKHRNKCIEEARKKQVTATGQWKHTPRIP